MQPYRDPSPPAELPALFGPYRIGRKLGAGGMGAVYLATDTRLGRPVALKLPHLTGDDPEAIRRFEREARAAAALDHPGLCPVYEFGRIDGRPYLAMAYIEGRPLADYVGGKLPDVRHVIRIVRKVAAALEAAHARGIIHRDLKPANVMIRTTGEPVVTDFGLALRYGGRDARITQTGFVMGTPAYMAPEQLRGDDDRIGPATDVWALGVILYECLTGRLPFDAPGMAVVGEVLNRDPAPPSRLRPEVGPALDSACLRALAKDPARRFPTMAAFATALADRARPEPAAPDVYLPAATTTGVWNGVVRAVPAGRAASGGGHQTESSSTSSVSDNRLRLAIISVAVSVLLLGGLTTVGILLTRGRPTTRLEGSTAQPDMPPTPDLAAERPPPLRESRAAEQVPPLPGPRIDTAPVRPDAPAVVQKSANDHFIPLFDGTSLTNWEPFPGGHARWTVEDGQLIGRGDSGLLFSRRGNFADFHLVVEARIGATGNSGVLFRMPYTKDMQHGYEAQINVGALHDARRTGSLLRAVHVADAGHRADEWFRMEVIAQGPRLRILVNRRVTADHVDPAPHSSIGFLALQKLTGEVRFRRIDIKELARAP